MGNWYLVILFFYIVWNLSIAKESNLLRVPLRRARLSFEKMLYKKRRSDMVEYQSTGLEMDYYGIISLGNPPQKFRVVFDTLSPFFWVTSTDCTAKYCSMFNKYNPRLSKTKKLYDNPIVINYQPNYVRGKVGSDVLTIGDKKVQNINFLRVESIANPQHFVHKFDGILGLAGLVSAHGLNSVLSSMVEQKIIDKKVFSVHLKKFINNLRTVAAGEIIFGGSDPKLYKPPLKYVKLTSNDKFYIKLDSIQMDKSTYCRNSCAAVFDTSTAFIGLPIIQLESAVRSVAGKIIGNKHEISCDKVDNLPRFSAVINGITFTLEGRDYIYKDIYDGKIRCVVGFLETQFSLPGSNFTYVLGNVFMRKYYTEFDFDKGRIGLAEAL